MEKTRRGSGTVWRKKWFLWEKVKNAGGKECNMRCTPTATSELWKLVSRGDFHDSCLLLFLFWLCRSASLKDDWSCPPLLLVKFWANGPSKQCQPVCEVMFTCPIEGREHWHRWGNSTYSTRAAQFVKTQMNRGFNLWLNCAKLPMQQFTGSCWTPKIHFENGGLHRGARLTKPEATHANHSKLFSGPETQLSKFAERIQ